MTTNQGLPTDRELIESYYQSAPNEKDLLHQRDVLAARNPETPEWVLRKVMEDASHEVLAGLAANRSCPHDLIPKILDRCAAFDQEGGGWAADYVRRSLAANPFAPSDVIDGLLGAADQETRRSAAANPIASKGELEKVQKDDDPTVRLAATANLSGPPPKESVLTDPDPRVREAAAHRRDAREILSDFARDPDAPVRQAVAANPNTPPETLRGLAAATGPDNMGVRTAAAANPNCPPPGKSAAGLLVD
jgi:hypothetical protein